MSDKPLPQAPSGEFVMFSSDDGKVRIECRFEGDTLWLSQAMMADLYQVTPQAITQHIKAVYDEGELDREATCKDYLQVQAEGKRQVRRSVRHYSSMIVTYLKAQETSTSNRQMRSLRQPATPPEGAAGRAGY